MSRLRANQITIENANGARNFPHGLTVTGIITATNNQTTFSNIVVGSAVTANSNGVDTVGIVTAGTFKNKAGGTFAPNPTTTQGDLIVRGASANERLAIGSAGQALKVNSSGNGLEYGSAAVIKKIHSFEFATRTNGSGSANNNQFTWTSSFVPLDPVNNSFMIEGSVPCNLDGNDFCGFGLRFEKSGGGITDFNGYGVQYVDTAQAHMGFYGYSFNYSGNFDGAGTYTIFHRAFGSSSNPGNYCPNSSDDSRLTAQTRGFLTIIEYKNA